MSEAVSAEKGVHVSRTIVPRRATNVPLRVLNVSDLDVRLNRETIMADLEPVKVFDTAMTITPKTRKTSDECINDLLNGPGPNLPTTTNRELKQLLR